MSYRKVARSYRRSAAGTYGRFEQRPRARLAAVAGLMVMVLGAGMAILIASHSGTALGTSGNAADLASGCTTPTATAPASTASAAPTATATSAPTTTSADRKSTRLNSSHLVI